VSVETRAITGEAELADALELRRSVFCEEQGVPEHEEFTDQDSQAQHLVAIADGEVLGTCRLLFDRDTVQLGRLAVDPRARHRGIATGLLAHAERLARATGAQRIVLDAQTQALELYIASGYRELGQRFLEVGIEHMRMEKSLA
jgi:predicted GNAT family N-acyltransferase